MKKPKLYKDDRRLFLEVLLDLASKSSTFNPVVYRREMMAQLGVSEDDFNIMQKRLGDRYCTFVDSHNDDNRYAIQYSECLALHEQYLQEEIREKRHREMVRLTVLSAILTALLTTALMLWFK
ncbi:MAG: hypothetical protein ABSB79_11280 [Syntrophales bacterium]